MERDFKYTEKVRGEGGRYNDVAQIKLYGINEGYIITTEGNIINKGTNKMVVPFYDFNTNKVLVQIGDKLYDYPAICRDYISSGMPNLDENLIRKLNQNGCIDVADHREYLRLRILAMNDVGIKFDFYKDAVRRRFGVDYDLRNGWSDGALFTEEIK